MTAAARNVAALGDFLNTLSQPGPKAPKSVTLATIGGRPFASTYPAYDHGFDRWDWIQRSIAEQFECHRDEVGCIETDNGDRFTIDGEPVAFLLEG